MITTVMSQIVYILDIYLLFREFLLPPFILIFIAFPLAVLFYVFYGP